MSELHGGPPNDWVVFLVSKGTAALSGLAGAYIRNIFPPYKPWTQRVPEYIGGALTAVYAGPVAGPILKASLEHFLQLFGVHLADALPAANVESLAGFMCGVVGLTVIEGIFLLVKRWRRNPTLPM